jgi:hypothetical protein
MTLAPHHTQMLTVDRAEASALIDHLRQGRGQA